MMLMAVLILMHTVAVLRRNHRFIQIERSTLVLVDGLQAERLHGPMTVLAFTKVLDVNINATQHTAHALILPGRVEECNTAQKSQQTQA